MLLPFVMAGHASATDAMAMPMPSPATAHGAWITGWLMVGAHTLGYLLTTTAVALLVYVKVGVRFLRTGWVNLDVVWAGALILTGLIALVT